MPVDLSLIPARLPEPKKFNFWWWGILLLVFLLLGVVLTLSLSFFYAIPNLLFWLGAVVLPIAVWVLVCLYGIYHRGYRETYIKQWNLQREWRQQQLIDYARRGLYVLHYSIMTEFGRRGNADGVTSEEYAISTKIPHGGHSPVFHSALPLPDGVSNHSDFSQRIKSIFSHWQSELTPVIKSLRYQYPLHVRLFIDSTITETNVLLQWSATLAKIITPSSLSVVSANSSTQFIEQWLDDSDHDNELLLVLSVRLFLHPDKNDAEAATSILFAGKNIAPLIKLESTPSSKPTRLAKVYRSEQTGELTNTIDKTLLWAGDRVANYDGVWYTGISAEQNIEIMNHFNEIKFAPESIFNIDTSIGYAGRCAYWLALSLAIEQTLQTKNRQLIIAGKPDITASVVASITREEL